MINHGTRSGYYAHRRLSDPPCDDCREAINKYVRDRREKADSRDRRRDRVRRKALSALREAHREEYQMLVDLFDEQEPE